MARYGRDYGRSRGEAGDMGSQYGGYGGDSGFGGRGGYSEEYDTDYGFDGYSGGSGGYQTGGRYAGSGYGRGGYGTDFADGYEGYGRGGRGESRGGHANRVRAADIMTDNPEVVTPAATLVEAARKMRDLNVGIIPVVESEQNRRLKGVITDRDIAVRAVAEGVDINTTVVQECMTSNVETCNKNDSVDQVLEVMRREQVRRVPITDREGRLVGIVAQADVATDLEGHSNQHRIADTLERISEPGRPEGGRRGR